MPNRPNSLPDPDQNDAGNPASSPLRYDVVIYDGQCGFCTKGVLRLHQLDRFQRKLSFLSLHDQRVKERYPDLSHDDLMSQMYVVDTKDRRHGGADAVRYLTRRLPLLWIFAPFMHFPFSAGLWRSAYRQVAKRRYQIAGKTCENDACSIHFD